MKKPKGKYAWTVTVGEKGQIVIPKKAREVFISDPEIIWSFWGTKAEGWPSRPKAHLPSLSPQSLKRIPMRGERILIEKGLS